MERLGSRYNGGDAPTPERRPTVDEIDYRACPVCRASMPRYGTCPVCSHVLPAHLASQYDARAAAALADWSRRWPLPAAYTEPARAALVTLLGGALAVVVWLWVAGNRWDAAIAPSTFTLCEPGTAVGSACVSPAVVPLHATPGQAYAEAHGLAAVFVPMLLLIMAWLYRLALLRLRRAGPLRTYLELAALGLVASLTLPVLLLAGGDAFHALGLYTTGQVPLNAYGGPSSGWFPLAGTYLTRLAAIWPQVVLWALQMAALMSALHLGCAVLFADWGAVRAEAPAGGLDETWRLAGQATREGSPMADRATRRREAWLLVGVPLLLLASPILVSTGPRAPVCVLLLAFADWAVARVTQVAHPERDRWDVLHLLRLVLAAAVLAGLCAMWAAHAGVNWGQVDSWWQYVVVLFASSASLSAAGAWGMYRRLHPPVWVHAVVSMRDAACVVQSVCSGRGLYGAYRFGDDGRAAFVAAFPTAEKAREALERAPRCATQAVNESG